MANSMLPELHSNNIWHGKEFQAFLIEQNRILKRFTSKHSLPEILTELALSVEKQISKTHCAVLHYDAAKGTLVDGVAPNLALEYICTIHGMKTGSNAGAYGAAVYRKKVVVIPDIATDPLCETFRDLSLSYGLRACWAAPIFSPDHHVLGAIVFYFKETRTPKPNEVQLLQSYGWLAGILMEYKLTKKRLNQLHQYDNLTGLPNRKHLKSRLGDAISHAKYYKRQLAVLHIDLDRFCRINNLVGYDNGDQLLREIAVSLRNMIRQGDVLSRWGNDEFILILQDISHQEANDLSNRIFEMFSESIEVNEHQLKLTPSIGISLYPIDGHKANSLIQRAETAMRNAKKKGKNTSQFYTAAMNERLKNKINLEAALHLALDRDEFLIYYQPQYSITENRLIGAEALIRWNHPEMGLIPPDEFIPIAEETGLIIPIGEWVFEKACTQAKIWYNEGNKIDLSVNLSFHQFKQPNLASVFRDIINKTGVEPSRIILELTESTIVKDMEITTSKLKQLKQLGLQISMDDFGVSYSSLNHLKHFPIDNVKIDRSFIQHISSDTKDLEIVKTIIQLCHALDLKVLAEGVEKKEQLSILQTYRCDEAQGYLYSPPLPLEEFHNYLNG